MRTLVVDCRGWRCPRSAHWTTSYPRNRKTRSTPVHHLSPHSRSDSYRTGPPPSTLRNSTTRSAESGTEKGRAAFSSARTSRGGRMRLSVRWAANGRRSGAKPALRTTVSVAAARAVSASFPSSTPIQSTAARAGAGKCAQSAEPQCKALSQRRVVQRSAHPLVRGPAGVAQEAQRQVPVFRRHPPTGDVFPAERAAERVRQLPAHGCSDRNGQKKALDRLLLRDGTVTFRHTPCDLHNRDHPSCEGVRVRKVEVCALREVRREP